MKVLAYITTKCSVLEGRSPNITRVHKQTIPVTIRNIRPLTVPSATGVTTRAPMKPVVVSQIHNERLVRLVLCLKGPALTAHRSFSQSARNTYAHCIAARQEKYGSRRHALIITLRPELSTVRQEEGQSMVTFGDRVYDLTNPAYPDLVNAPTLLQSFAVPAFLMGLRDRYAAQEVMKFSDPKSMQEAVVTVSHIQGASRIFGRHLKVPTARQVSFEDRPMTETARSS